MKKSELINQIRKIIRQEREKVEVTNKQTGQTYQVTKDYYQKHKKKYQKTQKPIKKDKKKIKSPTRDTKSKIGKKPIYTPERAAKEIKQYKPIHNKLNRIKEKYQTPQAIDTLLDGLSKHGVKNPDKYLKNVKKYVETSYYDHDKIEQIRTAYNDMLKSMNSKDPARRARGTENFIKDFERVKKGWDLDEIIKGKNSVHNPDNVGQGGEFMTYSQHQDKLKK